MSLQRKIHGDLKDTFDKNIVLCSMLGCLFEVCETQLVEARLKSGDMCWLGRHLSRRPICLISSSRFKNHFEPKHHNHGGSASIQPHGRMMKIVGTSCYLFSLQGGNTAKPNAKYADRPQSSNKSVFDPNLAILPKKTFSMLQVQSSWDEILKDK